MGVPDSPNGKEVFVPASRADWRAWLADRSQRTEGVWVLLPKQTGDAPGPSYDDAVEEALCFGWVDGQAARGDDRRSSLWFAPRRRGSGWARSNKERVERLIAAGLMTERGMAVIERARADGSWTRYDDANALVLHDDLAEALRATPAALDAFQSLAPSHRREHLRYTYEAKRPETRARRIENTIRRLTQ